MLQLLFMLGISKFDRLWFLIWVYCWDFERNVKIYMRLASFDNL